MKMFGVVVMMLCVGCVSDPVTAVSSSASTSGVPAAGWGDPGTTATANSDGSVTWCCSAWYTPISTSLGETIAGVQLTVRDNGSANGHPADGNNVTLSLVSDVDGSKTFLGTVTSNGSGNTQAMTLMLPTNHVVAAGELLSVRAIALRGGAIPGPAFHPSVIDVIRVIPPGPHSTSTIRAIGSTLAVPATPSSFGGPAARYELGKWTFTNGNFMYFPAPLEAGEVLTSYSVFCEKHTSSATAISTDIIEVDNRTGEQSVVLGSAFRSDLSNPGFITAGRTLSYKAVAGKNYIIRIGESVASSLDGFTSATISVERPLK